jgi:hypothetical protein
MKAILHTGLMSYAFADAQKAAQAAKLLAEAVISEYNPKTGKYEKDVVLRCSINFRSLSEKEIDIPELDKPKKRSAKKTEIGK